MTVRTAKWWRKHPVLASIAAFAAIAVIIVGVAVVVDRATRPDLVCGQGMVSNGKSTACVGIDLAGDRISPDQPDALGTLIAEAKRNNDAVIGSNYVSIVLLLNFSPIQNVDTSSYGIAYRQITGAITAVWQANHTTVFSGSPVPSEEPKVKLFLANMGSKNADWEKAVDQIAANATTHHVTSVVGLGQSTDNTRWAATKLTTTYRIPVIGSTVTGDSMNVSMADRNNLLNGFFRVAATNSDTVSAAARYLSEGLHLSPDKVAIVEDTVASDDYVSTLVQAAHKYLGTTHRFPFTSPDIGADIKTRNESLRGQFGYLDINLCDAQPEAVYFAGRGSDVGTFVRSWVESGTECNHSPLIVLTGDDGIEAERDDAVAAVVGGSSVKVQYTALASPGKWGPCGTTPAAAAERAAYDQFQAAYAGQPSCGTDVSTTDKSSRLAYPVDDLDDGQAMLTHDAVGLAVVAARRTGPSALIDRMSQVGVLQQTRCRTAFHGASGTIQYSADRQFYGNPVGVVLPIQNITADKHSETIPPGWAAGGPAATDGC